jgi:hypothetical protein
MTVCVIASQIIIRKTFRISRGKSSQEGEEMEKRIEKRRMENKKRGGA